MLTFSVIIIIRIITLFSKELNGLIVQEKVVESQRQKKMIKEVRNTSFCGCSYEYYDSTVCVRMLNSVCSAISHPLASRESGNVREIVESCHS